MPNTPVKGSAGQEQPVMLLRDLEKRDYDQVVQIIDRWSGGPTSSLVHPFLFYELGRLAQVVERESQLVGFLFGFLSQTEDPVGYVHLVGVHPDFRRRGIGRLLYSKFEADSRVHGCRALKAMTAPGNESATAFHKALGFAAELFEGYAGPGRPRVVFSKSI
jgi:ribosomal protein S18 acetylase RimI-like enzyme